MIIFIPRKLKYKKFQKNKKNILLEAFIKYLPQLGSYGLKVKKKFNLTFKHIEMIRILLSRKLKVHIKKPRVKINAHPAVPISKKSSGLRMGKGKASIKYWIYPAKKGKILFELYSKIPEPIAINILNIAKKKLSNKLKVINYKLPVLLKHNQNFFIN